MKLNATQFRQWNHKAITLLGMSGVGKTWLSQHLRNDGWFHYSGDYRIGTHYLDEAILDNLKSQAMQVPFLRELLLRDSIHITNNMTVDNLQPVSTFLGKLGNPEQGGLSLPEYRRRQKLYREAEIQAMLDVPKFIREAQDTYGYSHFVNDAGGSLCELDDSKVIDTLVDSTMIIYIQASNEDQDALLQRAKKEPKPMYYRDEFLTTQLSQYKGLQKLEYTAMISPDEFVRWVFPRILESRIPRYDSIANEHGYTVTSAQIKNVTSESDFLTLIESVL